MKTWRDHSLALGSTMEPATKVTSGDVGNVYRYCLGPVTVDVYIRHIVSGRPCVHFEPYWVTPPSRRRPSFPLAPVRARQNL